MVGRLASQQDNGLLQQLASYLLLRFQHHEARRLLSTRLDTHWWSRVPLAVTDIVVEVGLGLHVGYVLWVLGTYLAKTAASLIKN